MAMGGGCYDDGSIGRCSEVFCLSGRRLRRGGREERGLKRVGCVENSAREFRIQLLMRSEDLMGGDFDQAAS